MSVAYAWIKKLKSFWHVFTASVKPALTDGKSSIQTCKDLDEQLSVTVFNHGSKIDKVM